MKVPRIAIFLVACGGLLLPISSAIAAPPSLIGEAFNSQQYFGVPDAISNGMADSTQQCNNDGSGTVSFTASGTATGPYPGTFSESGTFTTTPTQPFANEPLTVLNATFTISSPAGDVSGTKSLTTPETSSGVCHPTGSPGQSNGSGEVNYAARITDSTGSYRESGNGVLGFFTTYAQSTSDVRVSSFGEAFLTSNGVAPELPATTDDCKNGGWERYGVFKNQGDCVSFVAAKGKNPPAGP
jgi:hypothetical protein